MPSIKCVYVSGPMTGLSDFNFPAFMAASVALSRAGYEVVNPVDLNPDPATPKHECMRADLRALADCDGVALLPGWDRSAGARLEVDAALAMGLVVAPFSFFVGATA